MKIIASAGRKDIAMVYIGEMSDGNLIECVESLQPPLPIEKKWVLMVSTMYGCPVGCRMCDAGGYYQGKPSKEDILTQIDFLVRQRFPQGRIPSAQWKIQFARMGEPSLNPAVLEVLDELPNRYDAPGLMPSISTIAPKSTGGFFERLLEIKNVKYTGGLFQFQYSIHTTDESLRDQLIPVKKWSFAEMSAYGERFYAPGDRKITLNFALSKEYPVNPNILIDYFEPQSYLIKITPLNPTYRARENQLSSYIDPMQNSQEYEIVQALQEAGYQVIVSVGEVEENYIGSNCGQYIRRHLSADEPIQDGYTYCVREPA
jgi:23S rRNA (adenine2503-C2)-methyltransferase